MTPKKVVNVSDGKQRKIVCVVDCCFCGLCAGARHQELAQLTVLLSLLVNWFGLGLQLGIHYHELKKMELEERGSVDRCLAAVLQRWMSEEDDVKSSGGATKEALVSALKQLQENTLAEAVTQATLGMCCLLGTFYALITYVTIVLLCLSIGLRCFLHWPTSCWQYCWFYS